MYTRPCVRIILRRIRGINIHIIFIMKNKAKKAVSKVMREKVVEAYTE